MNVDRPSPIRRLLVANRGEIARRIFATARQLGITTIAVFSDADADAPFVAEADLAVRLGAPLSYLSIDAILDAAARTEADAVHPGYGFLSENAEFARRCGEAGLCFVGPAPDTIAAMGDKVVAKRTMAEAGVPLVPGFSKPDADDATLIAAAADLGTPLLVKAVAGGGGRGMRVAQTQADVPAALASARAEAQNAFGNGALFLERLVRGARHIEVQILGDRHGHVHALGERECSVQRRHQKIIEEAPSPAVQPATREALLEAAVSAGQAVRYVGAGTVEFLLTDAGEFYFLEMNTRLQVEHPVTELVTGLDLVALQLQVAEGAVLESLSTTTRGHAIEARVYCEDPYNDFAPQLGPIALWQPSTAEHVRVDDGVRSGQEITPHYDAMVAKVIAWGPDRITATRRVAAAVRDSALLGPGSNRGFLLQLLTEDAFARAQIKTDTLDTRDGFGARPQATVAAWAVAAALLADGEAMAAWSSRGPVAWSAALRCDDHERNVQLRREPGPQLHATVTDTCDGEDTATILLTGLQREGTLLAVEVDGIRRRYTVVSADAHTVLLDDDGLAFRFEEVLPEAAHASLAAGNDVVAPIGGRVLAVDVAVGDAVAEGQVLARIEAMKMEHKVVATRGGTIAEVVAKAGGQIKAGEVLARLDAPSPKSEA